MKSEIKIVEKFEQMGKIADELKENGNLDLDFSDVSPEEKDKCKNFLKGIIFALEGKEEVSGEIHTISLSDSYWWTYSDYIDVEEIKCVLTNVEERFETAEKLIQGNCIILDVSKLLAEDAKIAFDYIAGVLYGLDGNIDKIENSVFKCKPLKTVIKGQAKEDCLIVDKNHKKIKEMMNENIDAEILKQVKTLYETNVALLEKNNIYSPAALTYGMLLLDKKLYNEAIEVFDRFYKYSRKAGRTNNRLYTDVIRLLEVAHKGNADNVKLEQFYINMIKDAEKENDYKNLPLLYNSLGHFYLVNKKSTDAKDILKKCVKLIEKHKITDKAIIAVSNNNLAHAYKNIGRFGKALSILDDIIANIEEKEVFDTIIGMKRTKAEIYETIGKYDKSLSLYEEVLEGYKTDLDKYRELYTTACGTMASIYDKLKNKEDMVEKMYLEAIKNYKEDEFDHNLAIYHNNLGAFYIGQKKYDAAKKELGNAVEIYNKLRKDPTDYAKSILVTQEHIVDLVEKLKKENTNV